MSIFGHCPHINTNTRDEAGQRQEPEDHAKGMRHPLLQSGGLVLQMEVDEDGNRNNSKVDGQAEPGEECSFIGTMIACIRRLVREQKWRIERLCQKQLQRIVWK